MENNIIIQPIALTKEQETTQKTINYVFGGLSLLITILVTFVGPKNPFDAIAIGAGLLILTLIWFVIVKSLSDPVALQYIVELKKLGYTEIDWESPYIGVFKSSDGKHYDISITDKGLVPILVTEDRKRSPKVFSKDGGQIIMIMIGVILIPLAVSFSLLLMIGNAKKIVELNNKPGLEKNESVKKSKLDRDI